MIREYPKSNSSTSIHRIHRTQLTNSPFRSRSCWNLSSKLSLRGVRTDLSNSHHRLIVHEFMDHWCGVLKVPLCSDSGPYYRVAASLCLSPTSKALAVPSANAIFFNGDRVEGTGNSVIERLSDLKTIAGLLVSKFGTSVNAWVFESSIFNGPFAVYKDFIPSVNRWGEPKSYSPLGFPASRSTISLLSNCLKEVKNVISRIEGEQHPTNVPALHFSQPKTLILGFSKGGTVINQLVTELSSSDVMLTGNTSYTEEQSRGGQCSNFSEAIKIIPNTEETLLNSITEVHYVDVGLNLSGAYLTDHAVIERIYKRLSQGAKGIRFLLHGTPRQWCDSRRNWVRTEKDNLVHMLESAARRSGGKLQVCERFYFADRPPNMQMHFEIIEELNVS